LGRHPSYFAGAPLAVRLWNHTRFQGSGALRAYRMGRIRYSPSQPKAPNRQNRLNLRKFLELQAFAAILSMRRCG
jgi:hypothetical protein